MTTEKRLIDANEPAEKILLECKRYSQTSELTFAGLTIAKNIVEATPTVDAVEVVRCKDCKRCDGFPGPDIARNEVGLCKINMLAVLPDGFCSYGERRTDGQRNQSFHCR